MFVSLEKKKTVVDSCIIRQGFCVDKHGNLLVCERENGIQQLTLERTSIRKINTDPKLQFPAGVASMSDDRIVITDWVAKEVTFLK